MINTYRILVGKDRRKETTKKTDMGGRKILKRTSERYDAVIQTGLIWLRIALRFHKMLETSCVTV
jgi:hypothetical protein